MKEHGFKALAKTILARAPIVVFFVMAFEVMIMISPFAFFFYSVFAPFFNFLGQHAATKWTTTFFLPHMILPPTLFLKTVRVLGSIFFLVGFFTFLVCAAQVYLGKIFHWGIAAKGIYKYIRHPQYLALGVWGMGMAILWPRFIVLATLAIMFILYYFLGKDEERRMLQEYGDSYERYLQNTGMFLPRVIETPLASRFQRLIPAVSLRYAVIPVMIVTGVLGTGFFLRAVTLRSLPLTSQQNIAIVPILPEDSRWGGEVLNSILAGAASGKLSFIKSDKEYLGYLMPVDYVMQGMIADTGGHFHLHKQHHTVALIVDWVLHPFEHLRRPPAAMMAKMHKVDAKIARRHHCPLGINQADRDCDTCTFRRVIFVEIE
ncbi:MAG: isoprenylcysteine carboxylmethyltransferase family protein, partial [Desulfobaccales bacterium]|nr:isoprenylcysteine carboxylmethyltransferase family protein [Desulfobaccales bacterium]